MSVRVENSYDPNRDPGTPATEDASGGEPSVVKRGPIALGTPVPQRLEYTPEYFVGRIVSRLRDERGWSQTALAERLANHGFELHQSTVAKLEAGKRPIRVNELVALASVFNVAVADLLPIEPGMTLNQDELAVKAREIAQVQAELRDADAQIRLAGEAIATATMQRDRAIERRQALMARFTELQEVFSSHGK